MIYGLKRALRKKKEDKKQASHTKQNIRIGNQSKYPISYSINNKKKHP